MRSTCKHTFSLSFLFFLTFLLRDTFCGDVEKECVHPCILHILLSPLLNSLFPFRLAYLSLGSSGSKKHTFTWSRK